MDRFFPLHLFKGGILFPWWSSGFWRLNYLYVSTKVSEEHTTSIFRDEVSLNKIRFCKADKYSLCSVLQSCFCCLDNNILLLFLNLYRLRLSVLPQFWITVTLWITARKYSVVGGMATLVQFRLCYWWLIHFTIFSEFLKFIIRNVNLVILSRF
jgi:hypothetical protein